MDWLNDIEEQIESYAKPTGEEEKFTVTDKAKEERWKEKRKGKITASTLPDLMRKGRGSVEWGETAKKVLYPIKYERRTGLVRREKDIFNLRFGKENEAAAIEWIRSKGYKIQCSDDFDDILFNEPFEGFGDSPDGIFNKGVVEIKCPVSQDIIEQAFDIEPENSDYYYQFLGHFIGDPTAKKLLYVVYDAYAEDGLIKEMYRKDHLENIELVTQRINNANFFLDRVMAPESKWKISQINEFFTKT